MKALLNRHKVNKYDKVIKLDDKDVGLLWHPFDPTFPSDRQAESLYQMMEINLICTRSVRREPLCIVNCFPAYWGVNF